MSQVLAQRDTCGYLPPSNLAPSARSGKGKGKTCTMWIISWPYVAVIPMRRAFSREMSSKTIFAMLLLPSLSRRYTELFLVGEGASRGKTIHRHANHPASFLHWHDLALQPPNRTRLRQTRSQPFRLTSTLIPSVAVSSVSAGRSVLVLQFWKS